MAKQSYSLLPDRKFRMLRVKHILENETDSAHSITMAQLLELLNEESDKDGDDNNDKPSEFERFGEH